MKRITAWKIFRLPSPKDLGWSVDDHNALPMRAFGFLGNEPTWEDWEEKMSKEYPIRYFFSETFPSWFRRRIIASVEEAWYWLACHTRKSKRYHLLDLSQPKKIDGKPNPDSYQYGHLDVDYQMMYALFNILNRFAENVPIRCPTQEEVDAEPHLLAQRNLYVEVKMLRHWWNVERKRTIRLSDDTMKAWSDAKSKALPEMSQLWDKVNKIDDDLKIQTDEMMLRLVKLRHQIWV